MPSETYLVYLVLHTDYSPSTAMSSATTSSAPSSATQPKPFPRRRPAALLPTFNDYTNYAYGSQGAEFIVFAHKHKSTTRSPAAVSASWRSRDDAMAALPNRKPDVPLWERRGVAAPVTLVHAPTSPKPRVYSPEELMRLSASPHVHVKAEWHAPLADAAHILLSGPQCKPRPRRRRQRAPRSAASTDSSASSSLSASSVASYFDMMSIGGSSFGTSGASSAEGSVFECSSSRSSSPMHSEEGSFPKDGEVPCPPDSARTTAW
ncbi:hypothetical protein PENSPDRAFT_737846 [Peniophora sp. CONT]|nr:hypothetical protein PENSPDRAFT_737846 [Peniophora sp. CONT]